MTAPDPTSLLSQAEAAIAVRREMLANATPGDWKLWGMQVLSSQDGTSNVDTAVPVAQTYFRDEHGKPRTFDAQVIRQAPAVFAAATDHAESVLGRHRPDPKPIELMLHMDEECPTGECEEGDGHLSIVCRGCYPAWDGMQAYAVWPCPDARDALTALGIVVE